MRIIYLFIYLLYVKSVTYYFSILTSIKTYINNQKLRQWFLLYLEYFQHQMVLLKETWMALCREKH